MSTLPQQQETERTLSFRVSPEFWERVGIAVRKEATSTKAFCTEAIEKHLDRIERKHAAANEAA